MRLLKCMYIYIIKLLCYLQIQSEDIFVRLISKVVHGKAEENHGIQRTLDWTLINKPQSSGAIVFLQSSAVNRQIGKGRNLLPALLGIKIIRTVRCTGYVVVKKFRYVLIINNQANWKNFIALIDCAKYFIHFFASAINHD